jgi:hypothetical protein
VVNIGEREGLVGEFGREKERDVHVEKDRALVALCDGVICVVCGLGAANDVALEG